MERIQHDFLAGVQKHLRALTFVSLWKNVQMVRPEYSRSNRIGELYDEVFYRPAWNNPIWKNDVPKSYVAAIDEANSTLDPAKQKVSFGKLVDEVFLYEDHPSFLNQ